MRRGIYMGGVGRLSNRVGWATKDSTIQVVAQNIVYYSLWCECMQGVVLSYTVTNFGRTDRGRGKISVKHNSTGGRYEKGRGAIEIRLHRRLKMVG